VVEDPHWIYPGEVLRLPDGQADTTMTVADRLDTDREPAPQADLRPQTATVFATALEAPSAAFAPSNPVRQQPRAAIREGEFLAAPWIDVAGGPAAPGRIVASVQIPGIVEPSPRMRVEPQERVYISLPHSVVPARGDRYLTFRLGRVLDDGRQIVVPTGVVLVEHADNGDATTVRAIMQFDEMKIGDGVMRLPVSSAPADASPTPIELGPQATVLWISSESVQPTIQHYAVLSASGRDGVKLGDRFTILRPRVRTEDGVVLPPEPIALLQIVRVTDSGSTGIVIDQRHPAIKQGALAQLTARMP